MKAGLLGDRQEAVVVFRPKLSRQQEVPVAETGVFPRQSLQFFPRDIFEGRDLEKVLDGRLHGWIHVSPFYQLENSLLKISSVRLLVIVGNNCCSASVMEVWAEKSKFRVTSVSKLAWGTFFPVGSRLFLKTICTVTASRLLDACWFEIPDVL